uniref:Cytochrome P450 n=1 Tax=Populus davidiana TaxID=266767 RepID=A0A6M2E970_9ROSI
MELQEITLYALLLGIISLFLSTKYATKNKKKGKMPPEPAGSWPIIGHLHLLGGANQLLHRTFGVMADKYGPIFSVCHGIRRVLVVSNWEIVKECLATNDMVFAARPKYLAVKIMGYDHAMLGFAPYGQYWRDMRKLTMVELLSNSRLEMLKHVRDTEIKLLLKDLHDRSIKNGGHVTVEMKEKFGSLTMNIIVRMLAGKRYFGTDTNGDEESARFLKALGDFFYLLGLFLVSDAVPFLGWLDFVKGFVGKMKRTATEIDCVFSSWVEDHRRNRLNGSINEEERDFIHVLLSNLEDGKISAVDTDTAIKGTCLSLILGGHDTTFVTLTWALSLILNNREVLEKAQDELDIQVGKHRQVDETDIKNLVYLQAIVKETMRLYPAAQLSAPRQAMEDCTVAGFHIPAGTRLLVNLWKLHRDPNIWSNPLEFQPERFLKEHANLDVRGQDFEYVPFGSGRRMCPGISLALQVLHLTLARLLHGFEMGRVSDALIDMSEGPGITIPKETPLEVILCPRLHSSLYEC